jgi:hypothetical protein
MARSEKEKMLAGGDGERRGGHEGGRQSGATEIALMGWSEPAGILPGEEWLSLRSSSALVLAGA